MSWAAMAACYALFIVALASFCGPEPTQTVGVTTEPVRIYVCEEVQP